MKFVGTLNYIRRTSSPCRQKQISDGPVVHADRSNISGGPVVHADKTVYQMDQ